MVERESQFEIMRTVAMFLIVVYHCLTHGVGCDYFFYIDQPVSLSNLLFSDLMLTFSSISVNLYVMISGYFLSDLNFKLSRIIRIWLQVCFYSFTITIIMMALGIIPFNIVTIGKSFFPLSTDAYWFVTQFIGLLIISPFLTMLARNMSYQQYISLLIGGGLLCLSIIPDFPLGKRFHVAHGNSVWSFAYLYMFAGFIKHHFGEKHHSKLIMAIILMTFITVICEFFYGHHNGAVSLYWFNYNGLPFVLSILMFLLLRQIQVGKSTFCNGLVKLAPYSFGVYLIHDHILIRTWLWNSISITSFGNQWIYPILVLGVCLALFMFCTVVDTIRKRLFKWIGIDRLVARADRQSFGLQQ